MTRQVTDNLYIDLGYFTPEEYYVYEAEASFTESINSNFSVTATKISQGSAAMSSATDTSTQAEIVKVASAVLEEAFTWTATDERLRGFTSALEEAFTWSAVGNRNASIDLVALSDSAVSAQAERTRDFSSALEEAFTWSADVNKVVDFDSDLTADSNFTASATRTKQFDSDLDDSTSVSAQAVKTTESEVDLLVEATVTASATRIQEFDSDLNSASTVNAVSNAVFDQDSAVTATATLSANGGLIKQGSMNGDAIATALTAAAKVGVFVADLSSAVTVTATAETTKVFDSTLSSVASMTTNGGLLLDATVGQEQSGIALSGTHLRITDQSLVDTGNFLISFWAADLYQLGASDYGTILNAGPADSSDSEQWFRLVAEDQNSIKVIQRTDYTRSEHDLRTITWNVDTSGWHHYVLYQSTGTVSGQVLPSTTNMQLYQDGRLVTVSSVVNSDNTTTLNTVVEDKLLLSPIRWRIGASVNFNSFNEDLDADIYQFAVWFNSSAPFNRAVATPATFLDKLYNIQGPLDLGPDGSGTGLRKADFYLGLSDYTDITDEGYLAATVDWLDGTTSYTATSADNGDPYRWPIGARTTISVSGETIQVIAANLASAANLTASARTNKGFQSALNAVASLSGSATKIKQFSSAINSEGFVLAAVNKVGSVVVDMPAVATMTIDAVKFVSATSALQSDTDCIPQATKTAVVDAAFNTDFQVIVSGETVRPYEAYLNVESTVLANGGINRQAQADLDAISTITAQGTTGIFASAQLSTESFWSADAVKLTGIIQNLASEFNLSASARRVLFGSATLLGQGFVLVAGRVISLDDYTTYVIEQETGVFKITQETRQYQIEQELRDYAITEETREYKIDESTAVNII